MPRRICSTMLWEAWVFLAHNILLFPSVTSGKNSLVLQRMILIGTFSGHARFSIVTCPLGEAGCPMIFQYVSRAPQVPALEFLNVWKSLLPKLQHAGFASYHPAMECNQVHGLGIREKEVCVDVRMLLQL